MVEAEQKENDTFSTNGGNRKGDSMKTSKHIFGISYYQIQKWLWQDWVTWVIHGLHGVWIVALYDVTGMGITGGVMASVLTFAFREVPGIVKNGIKYVKYFGMVGNNANRRLLIDGLMDFFSPLLGNGLYIWAFV